MHGFSRRISRHISPRIGRRISLTLAAAIVPALALTTAGSAGAAPVPDPPARIVPVQLAKAEAGVSAVQDTYIVELKKGVRLKSGLGIAPQRQFSTAVNGFSAKLTPSQLAGLQKNPDVVAISQDVYAQNVLDTTQTNPPSWGIDRIDQRNLPLSNSFTYTRTGAGVHAYIIDSGVDPSHPNFGGRASFDFNGHRLQQHRLQRPRHPCGRHHRLHVVRRGQERPRCTV